MVPRTCNAIDDCVIVGGGIIGLSLAVELRQQGCRVRLLDIGKADRTASWAAAGILPPPITRALHDPLERLRDLSHQLYPRWCRKLSNESGVEVSYDVCGGLYLGRSIGERVSLQAALVQWTSDGVRAETWSTDRVRRAEPNLIRLNESAHVYFLPDEALVRPPRILKALRATLQRHNVPIESCDVLGWDSIDDDRVSLKTTVGVVRARHCCVAAGPWSPLLLRSVGFQLPVEPRRGQMVSWRLPTPPITHVINEGLRYLIPRPDGYLLAGSTVEDVGYDASTTDEGVAELSAFARSLLPLLANYSPIQSWAGLRPWSYDGKPYLGLVPGQNRVSVATGHFRSGIHLAPASGRLMRQLICGQTPDLDLNWFSPLR